MPVVERDHNPFFNEGFGQTANPQFVLMLIPGIRDKYPRGIGLFRGNSTMFFGIYGHRF
jgi:hypothetical protein